MPNPTDFRNRMMSLKERSIAILGNETTLVWEYGELKEKPKKQYSKEEWKPPSMSADKSHDVMPKRDQSISKKKEMFDAFVCSSSSIEDMTFVRELVKVLEIEHGLKLFIQERDLMVGAPFHSLIHDVIAERCKRVIVVMSPDLVEDEYCDFQTKIALMHKAGVIPILFKKCERVPFSLRGLVYLKYPVQEVGRSRFWAILAKALSFPEKKMSIYEPNSPSKYSLESSFKSPVSTEEKLGLRSEVLRGQSSAETSKIPGYSFNWRCQIHNNRRRRRMDVERVIYCRQCREELRKNPSWSNGIREIIQKCAGNLFRDHTNLNAISACPVRSNEARGSYDVKPCIVLYCDRKGEIPDGESEFPTDLEGVPTDIREAVFRGFPGYGDPNRRVFPARFYHDPLKIGSSVSRQGCSSYGTLGGFVEDIDNPE